MNTKDKFERDTKAVIRDIIAKVADPFGIYHSDEAVNNADAQELVYGMVVGQCSLLCAVGENALRMAAAGLISDESAASCEKLTNLMSDLILKDLESVHASAATEQDDTNVVAFPTPKGVH